MVRYNSSHAWNLNQFGCHSIQRGLWFPEVSFHDLQCQHLTAPGKSYIHCTCTVSWTSNPLWLYILLWCLYQHHSLYDIRSVYIWKAHNISHDVQNNIFSKIVEYNIKLYIILYFLNVRFSSFTKDCIVH